VETGSKEERGWNPLGITKKIWGEPQITQAIGRRSFEKKEVQMSSQGPVKGFYTQGHRTCLVKGPDFSGGTPDRTCLVRLGFSKLKLVPENLAIYNLVDGP
jgi:hypothetical protein